MKLNVIDEGIVWKNSYPAIRSLVGLKGYSLSLGNGQVLHTLQVGQARQSKDSRCISLRSKDYGKTWEQTNPILPNEDLDPRYAYGRTMLSQMSDGTIWASSIRLELVEPEDPRWRSENCGWVGGANYICCSIDRGRTWSKPYFLSPVPPEGGFPVISSPVYELATGELMVVFEPFYTQTLGEMRHEVAALYSPDGGESWPNQSVIAQDPNNHLVYFDPRMTQLEDGRWICMFWTHDKESGESLNTSISYSDDGHTWTTPQLTTLWGFLSLPLTIFDGRLLAVFNHRRIPPGIRCAISEDTGRTWDTDGEYVLWDGHTRSATGELASKSEKRLWKSSTMREMFTWDFGAPYPVLLDDDSVLVTFYATQMDHIMHQRYIRFKID